MASHKKQTTFAEILRRIESLAEEVKVLVTAVDDLRCEVEWQIKLQADADELPPHVKATEKLPMDGETDTDGQARDVTAFPRDDNSEQRSAADELRELEELLKRGPRGKWQDDWATDDDVQLPPGRVIPVDADLWDGVLELRPAHVVGEGCCCEEGMGAPYLLAWQGQEPGEYFLRELRAEESFHLRRLCLAAQAEQQALADARRAEFSAPAATQQDLF